MKKTQNKFYDLLKTDEAVFDFFQRYALDGIIFQDLSTPKNSWVNDKLYEVLGYVDEEQNVLNDILSSPQIKNNLPLIKKQNNLTTEVCFKHKNGKDIWMVATSLYYSENDTIVTALKDITRTKEHELILENCNQEAQIGFWEIDILETNKLYWSSVTKDIHEVEHHYIPNIESAIFFYKEGYNRNIIAELHSLAINKGISYTQELEIVTAKGNEKWIRTTCIPKLVNGKCISLYGTFQDITTQKRLNQQLEEEKVKLKNVIEGARIGTWEWNVQSGETIYNHRWAEMLGYTLAEISPMNINIWNNLVHPEDLKKSETLLENCFNKKSDYYEGEFRM
ncbi:MAG: PAS domain-containing protein, partial [Bacteroidia bacterium]